MAESADYHRWFILPVVETEVEDPQGGTEIVKMPKYMDEDRLSGYSSGGPFDREQVERAGYDHLLAHNDAEEWRVVVAWGDGDEAWDALNEIHARSHDSETLADHGQDVAPVMDDRFGEGEWSIDALALGGSDNTA